MTAVATALLLVRSVVTSVVSTVLTAAVRALRVSHREQSAGRSGSPWRAQHSAPYEALYVILTLLVGSLAMTPMVFYV